MVLRKTFHHKRQVWIQDELKLNGFIVMGGLL